MSGQPASFTKCQGCGKSTTGEAGKCPYCGVVLDFTVKKPAPSAGLMGCMALIAAIPVVIVVALMLSANSPEHRAEMEALELRTKLLRTARKAVTASLKSPGSARFCPDSDVKILENPITHHYLVTGWVDAQNGFGALLRQDWRVKLYPADAGLRVDEVAFGK